MRTMRKIHSWLASHRDIALAFFKMCFDWFISLIMHTSPWTGGVFHCVYWNFSNASLSRHHKQLNLAMPRLRILTDIDFFGRKRRQDLKRLKNSLLGGINWVKFTGFLSINYFEQWICLQWVIAICITLIDDDQWPMIWGKNAKVGVWVNYTSGFY